MNRCAACGTELPVALNLCPHHYAYEKDSGWAATNRIMCDFLHRGVVPSRLRTTDRDEDLHGCLAEAA